MSGRNSIKPYVENGYYHIYNRGVEKRIIFQDTQDYGVYLSYLKEYLSPKDEKELRNRLLKKDISSHERDQVYKLIRMNNFSQEITLLAFCLMPNHFHFFIKQQNSGSIDKFMNSLSTRYVMYFNRKYKRVGSLYQDVYKAVLVSSEEQYLHITRYIHKQAMQGDPLHSSYPDYIGVRKLEWMHPEEILSFFSKTNPTFSYEHFVNEYQSGSYIDPLTADDE